MERKKVGFGLKAAYGVGDLGMNLFSMAVGSFITVYYTDQVLLSAAFVGTMMLLTRFLDGISDIIMGIIVDHTNTRIGKARPWLLASIIPLGLSLVLLFHVPEGLSVTGKEIYAYATYIFSMVICGTASNLSYSTLCTLMSDDVNVRTGLAGARTLCSNIGSMIATTATLAVITGFGGGSRGYLYMAVVYAVIVMICLLITGLCCKEYAVTEKQMSYEVTPVAEAVKLLLGNRYAWAVTGCFIFNWIAISINGGAMVYYARDVLHNAGYVSMLALSISLPAIILLAVGVVPRLTTRYGKRNMLLFGSFLQVVGFAAALFVPESILVVLAGLVIRTCGLGIFVTNLFASVADVADYVDLKYNVHIAGVTNSVTSFGMKVGVGLGSAALGWVLAAGGYSAELANSGAVQSGATIFAERMCYTGIPVICSVLVLVLSSFINVDRKLEELRRGARG